MPRCLSEGVDIFLKSAERQGESGHDVRVSRLTPWMASVGGPVMMRTAISLFNRKFTPGDATSRRDVLFAASVRGVYGNPTLRTMHSIHSSSFSIWLTLAGSALPFIAFMVWPTRKPMAFSLPLW